MSTSRCLLRDRFDIGVVKPEGEALALTDGTRIRQSFFNSREHGNSNDQDQHSSIEADFIHDRSGYLTLYKHYNKQKTVTLFPQGNVVCGFPGCLDSAQIKNLPQKSYQKRIKYRYHAHSQFLTMRRN